MGYRGEDVNGVTLNENVLHCQTHKMVKHTQTIRQLLPTNPLIVFDHLKGLALKGITFS